MIEGLTILSLFVVIFLTSKLSKNATVSLFLGMFFIIFSFMIIKTAPHLRHEHNEEFSLSHLINVLSGKESSKIVCPVCHGNDISIMITDNKESKVVIKCNSCKTEVDAKSIDEAIDSWKLKGTEDKNSEEQ